MTETRKELAAKACIPCAGGVPPLTCEQQDALLTKLGDGWKVVEGHHIARSFQFPDFLKGLAFVNAVADVAETEAHHPDLHLSWGEVRVTVWTHKIDGLTESDFVLGAKISETFARGNNA